LPRRRREPWQKLKNELCVRENGGEKGRRKIGRGRRKLFIFNSNSGARKEKSKPPEQQPLHWTILVVARIRRREGDSSMRMKIIMGVKIMI
jgi:hypothetical protein